jgi:hypothetical protein
LDTLVLHVGDATECEGGAEHPGVDEAVHAPDKGALSYFEQGLLVTGGSAAEMVGIVEFVE